LIAGILDHCFSVSDGGGTARLTGIALVLVGLLGLRAVLDAGQRPDFDIESLESNRFCVSLSLLRVSMNPTVDRRSAHGPKPGFVPRW
jgi:hypothetical protein